MVFVVKLGGSQLQAVRLQLKTCPTSGPGSRFAFMVVHALVQWVDMFLD